RGADDRAGGPYQDRSRDDVPDGAARPHLAHRHGRPRGRGARRRDPGGGRRGARGRGRRAGGRGRDGLTGGGPVAIASGQPGTRSHDDHEDARGLVRLAASRHGMAGRRRALALLVTRPEGERDPLVARLRALGYRVHAAPTVATEPLAFAPPDLAAFDWVVVTSATGVDALLDAGPAPPGGGPARWAAVGPRTAAALAGRGIAA